jgi:hypothetical protein
MLNLVFQNQERYDNIDDLRHDLTIVSGYYTERVNIQGEHVKMANSISFAKMTETEFSNLYDSFLTQVQKYFHFDKETVNENLEQFY